MLQKIINFINNFSKSEEQQYLENSSDICDLENRMKNLKYGNAPFQIRNDTVLKSYRGIYQ